MTERQQGAASGAHAKGSHQGVSRGQFGASAVILVTTLRVGAPRYTGRCRCSGRSMQRSTVDAALDSSPGRHPRRRRRGSWRRQRRGRRGTRGRRGERTWGCRSRRPTPSARRQRQRRRQQRMANHTPPDCQAVCRAPDFYDPLQKMCRCLRHAQALSITLEGLPLVDPARPSLYIAFH